MILTCALIDDEPLALELLAGYVKRTPFLKLAGKFNSAVEALDEMQQAPAQLIFCDIQMPGMSGLEFARQCKGSRIVFTTAYSDYALEGYRVDASDYLLKPIEYAAFLESASKALSYYMDKNEGAIVADHERKSLFVKADYKLVRIFFDDILYIEGLKDYVKIYLASQRKPVLTLTSMHSIESFLPSSQFLRTHRSYIVNMERVNVMERGQILFDDKYVPISETYKDSVSEYVNKRLLSR